MLNISNYVLQYSNVNVAAVSAAAPQLFITEAAPISGTPALSDAEVEALVAADILVVGYVESSVTDAGRPYWNTAWTDDGTDTGVVQAGAPEWLKTGITNPFGIIVDIRDAAWRQIVIDQAVDLVTRGYSGVFLDDVSQYYALGNGVTASIQEFATSMLTLVSEVKAAIKVINPDAVVIVNSTPYIVSDAVGGIASAASQAFLLDADAMLLESFFGINRAAEEAGIAQAASAIAPMMTVLTMEFAGTAYQNYLYTNQATALGFIAGTSPSAAYNQLPLTPADATTGDDILIGTARADTIDLKAGNDSIWSGAGADTINGGDGNDSIYGVSGADVLSGGNGNDFLNGGEGTDFLNGGAGIDTAAYNHSITKIYVALDKSFAANSEASGDTFAGIENILGSAFADKMAGNSSNNLIRGGTGSDIIYGRAGNDRLFGDDGSDNLFGEQGNDYLYGGNGADVINGGTGVDTAAYNYSSVGINVSLDKSFAATSEAIGDTLIAIENISGSAFVDKLAGNSSNNSIRSGTGSDTIYGRAGHDKLYGEDGNDKLYGEQGNDYLYGGAGSNALYGGDGDDILHNTVGYDSFNGGAGSDWVVFEDSVSTVLIVDLSVFGVVYYNQSGEDFTRSIKNVENVVGTDYSDTIFGDRNDNEIHGLKGDDFLVGGDGDDTLIGGEGNDQLTGQNGFDIYYGGKGADYFDGSALPENGLQIVETDLDYVTYIFSPTSVTVDLSGQRAQTNEARGDIFLNITRLEGSRFSDRLYGDQEANVFWGDAGNDHVFADNGDDTIFGGLGKDYLSGGEGVDSFAYWASNEGGDTISSFAAFDYFGFKGSSFGKHNAGAYLKSSAFHTNTTGNAHDTSDRFIYETDSDRLWYDADGTGSKAEILIADIATDAKVTAGDIWIF